MSQPREPFPTGIPWEPRGRAGLVASVLLHLGVILGIVFGGSRFLSSTAGGPGLLAGGGGGGAGGGDGQIRYVTMAPPPPPAAAQPQEAVPVEAPEVIPPPEPEPEEEVEEPEVVAQTDTVVTPVNDSILAIAAAVALGEGIGAGEAGFGPGSGGGSGGGRGGGTGTGVGPGSGPGSGGGGLARDPEPRQMIMPPEARGEDRGGTFVVTFYVKADGRVQRVDVNPEPKDRRYAREFRERMEGFLFKPARSADGTAVAGVLRIKVGL